MALWGKKKTIVRVRKAALGKQTDSSAEATSRARTPPAPRAPEWGWGDASGPPVPPRNPSSAAAPAAPPPAPRAALAGTPTPPSDSRRLLLQPRARSLKPRLRPGPRRPGRGGAARRPRGQSKASATGRPRRPGRAPHPPLLLTTARPPAEAWLPAPARRGPHPDLAADLGADLHGSGAGGGLSTAKGSAYWEPESSSQPAASPPPPPPLPAARSAWPAPTGWSQVERACA